MSYLRGSTFLFVSLIALVTCYQSAFACKCTNDNSVLGNFEQAKFVVIANAISVEEEPKVETIYSGSEEIKETKFVVKSTKMVVEKVYKGDLKVGDEMIFGQGGDGGSCLRDFDKDVVGNKFLLYLDSKEKKPKIWFVNMCSRSASIPADSYDWTGNAADDLLFLDNLEKLRGKTRISGTVFAYLSSPFKGEVNRYRNFAGLKVRVIGEGKTYETITNKDGVYEIYDLPAGNYKIQPEIPTNWKIDIWGGYSTSTGNRWQHENLSVTLQPQKHAFYNLHLELDNKIRGKVLDPFGRPIEDVCAQLLPSEGEPREDFVRSRTGCTKEDGSFEIKEVPSGNYKIVINKENVINSQYPFNTVFYPNVSQIEDAKIISVADAEDKEGIEIRVPASKELIRVNGVLLSADGVPVTNAWVSFVAIKTDANIEGNAVASTDENGRFSIKILKGLQGALSGRITLDKNQFSACPQIIKLINENGRIDWIDKSSNAIEIKADKNFENVELRLPFPSCNKTKIVGRVKIDF